MLGPQFAVPEARRVRVVIVTDAANEADDAFAVAHALLTPSFDVRGIVASHFGKLGSTERSYAELEALLDVLNLAGAVPLARGASGPIGTCVAEGDGSGREATGGCSGDGSGREAIAGCGGDDSEHRVISEYAGDSLGRGATFRCGGDGSRREATVSWSGDSSGREVNGRPSVGGEHVDCPGERNSDTCGCEGVDLIIAEARRDDDRPLYVLDLCGLGEVALALRSAPELATRMTVIWVGGGRYPIGSHEANLARDLPAAREVLASDVPLWQVPSGAYKRLTVSLTELRLRLSRCGTLGEHLWGQLNAFASANVADRAWINPESWVLGDQAAVGVLLAEQKGCFDVRPAPGIADDYRYEDRPSQRAIRVYHDLDVRLVLEDMFAKFELAAL